MLSDVALRSIALNLAALSLDPLLHLKIAAAIVAPLMEGDATAPIPTPLTPPKPHRSPSRKAAPPKKTKARKGKPEAVPIVYDGEIFPSRSAMARHLAPILGKSAVTLARALLDAGDDAEAVVRRYQPEPRPEVTFHRGKNAEITEADFDERPGKRPSAPSPEARAKQWLEERLERGPFPASDFEDAIARHEFDGRSAEQAKTRLGLVARRVANGHGQTVHLCFPAQAAALDAQGGIHG
jgi:hypothetical protein